MRACPSVCPSVCLTASKQNRRKRRFLPGISLWSYIDPFWTPGLLDAYSQLKIVSLWSEDSCLNLWVCVHQSIHPSVGPSVGLSVGPSVGLSFGPSVGPSAKLSKTEKKKWKSLKLYTDPLWMPRGTSYLHICRHMWLGPFWGKFYEVISIGRLPNAPVEGNEGGYLQHCTTMKNDNLHFFRKKSF